jgi:hypothetical protein
LIELLVMLCGPEVFFSVLLYQLMQTVIAAVTETIFTESHDRLTDKYCFASVYKYISRCAKLCFTLIRARGVCNGDTAGMSVSAANRWTDVCTGDRAGMSVSAANRWTDVCTGDRAGMSVSAANRWTDVEFMWVAQRFWEIRIFSRVLP